MPLRLESLGFESGNRGGFNCERHGNARILKQRSGKSNDGESLGRPDSKRDTRQPLQTGCLLLFVPIISRSLILEVAFTSAMWPPAEAGWQTNSSQSIYTSRSWLSVESRSIPIFEVGDSDRPVVMGPR